MKDRKYILRTPHDPFEVWPYSELHEHIGNNVGNLVYVAGVTRALMVTDDTSFTMPRNKFAYTDEEIDEINQTYDGFIISLADAIRDNYIRRLNRTTAFINKLKIPCVVIGCGLRAPYEPGSDMSFPYDEDVKAFFRAVLDHSAVIGLRGQITADYAKHLGFREEADYTVIGCPSMYMYGQDISCKDSIPHLLSDPDARCSFNVSPVITEKALMLIDDLAGRYPRSVYMPQNSLDEILMYYGVSYDKPRRSSYWPTKADHPFYKDHEALFFNNPLSWIEFQKGMDLSFGTRLHGNVTSVLAGTPTLFMPQEARTRELCEYHGFAHLTPAELENMDSLLDILPSMDFQSPVRRHRETFAHYKDFLSKNGLPSIFDGGQEGESPYDRKTRGYESMPPLRPVTVTSPELVKKRQKERERALTPPKVSVFKRAYRKIRKAVSNR